MIEEEQRRLDTVCTARTPRTCDQTGNDAPRFPWSRSPGGRTARILIQCIAYHLGYSDERMGTRREFPPCRETFALFERTMQWFADEYDRTQRQAAAQRGYPLVLLEPFCPADVHGRLHYLFAKPGSRAHDTRARVYGISTEHPASEHQGRPGGRREVFDRCAQELLRRLAFGETVSAEEAEDWGRK